jgi:hypothetical protein
MSPCATTPDGCWLRPGHGFSELPGPVLVEQPHGIVEMPMLTMWRPLRAGVTLPDGRASLDGLPF